MYLNYSYRIENLLVGTVFNRDVSKIGVRNRELYIW